MIKVNEKSGVITTNVSYQSVDLESLISINMAGCAKSKKESMEIVLDKLNILIATLELERNRLQIGVRNNGELGALAD